MKVKVKIKNKNRKVMSEQLVDTLEFAKDISKLEENLSLIDQVPENVRPTIKETITRDLFIKKRWIGRVNKIKKLKDGN